MAEKIIIPFPGKGELLEKLLMYNQTMTGTALA